MAQPTYSDFSADDVRMAQFAKALSHPARVAILKVLFERQECVCGEIVKVVPLAQSTVSQHLRELKNAGLIQGRISGPKSCYCVHWGVMDEFKGMLETFMGLMQDGKNACVSC